MPPMLVTFAVLKFERLSDARLLQLENMLLMLVTLEVLNPERTSDVRLEHS